MTRMLKSFFSRSAGLGPTRGVVRTHAIGVADEDLSPIIGDSGGVHAIQPTVLVHRLNEMHDGILELPAREVHSPQVESGVIQHPDHGPLVVRRDGHRYRVRPAGRGSVSVSRLRPVS